MRMLLCYGVLLVVGAGISPACEVPYFSPTEAALRKLEELGGTSYGSAAGDGRLLGVQLWNPTDAQLDKLLETFPEVETVCLINGQKGQVTPLSLEAPRGSKVK